MNKSIERKSIKGAIFFFFILIAMLQPFMGIAQSGKRYTYYGYGLSVSVPSQTLRSNIAQLNGLKVNFIGCNAGGMIANSRGKLKANLGLYYSDSSVPYEIDMIRGNISGSVYLLRLNNARAHLLEPYATLGVSQQVSKFYGTFLSNDPTISSTSGQPFLGKVNSTRLNFGGGIELQLENLNQKFIHVFAEMVYGTSLGSSASNSSFAETKVTNAITFTLGINFGIAKINRK